jgi:hypothetical protein
MELRYRCDVCGEENGIDVEPEAGRLQRLVEDCAVCCRPLAITARWNVFSDTFDLEVHLEERGTTQ